MAMQEIWHSVVGYEGLYEVSNMGRVKSMGRTTRTGQVFPPRMLVCSIDRGGARLSNLRWDTPKANNAERGTYTAADPVPPLSAHD